MGFQISEILEREKLETEIILTVMGSRGEEMRGTVKVHRGTFWGEECYMFSLFNMWFMIAYACQTQNVHLKRLIFTACIL